MNEQKPQEKLKYNVSNFKFETTPQRLKQEILDDYEKAKAKKKKDDFDKMYIQVVKAKLKMVRMKLTGTHIPSGVQKSWVIETEDPDRTKHIAELMLLVRASREQKKIEIKRESKQFDGAKYETIGGVFVKGGLINAIGTRCTTNDPMVTKKPRKPRANYIGVELEFNPIANQSTATIGTALKNAGLARYVHVGTDGSCGNPETGTPGFEVRLLLEEAKFAETLTKVCQVIRDLGFSTDNRCGTHIHLDMRNRNIKTCYANLFQSQLLLRKFLTFYRKKNIYCVKNSHATYDDHIKSGSGRRCGINTHSYDKFRTLEIRMHQGTLDDSKLIPWINLLLKIVNYDGNLDKKVQTLKQARETLKVDDSLFKDLSARLLNRGA